MKQLHKQILCDGVGHVFDVGENVVGAVLATAADLAFIWAGVQGEYGC